MRRGRKRIRKVIGTPPHTAITDSKFGNATHTVRMKKDTQLRTPTRRRLNSEVRKYEIITSHDRFKAQKLHILRYPGFKFLYCKEVNKKFLSRKSSY